MWRHHSSLLVIQSALCPNDCTASRRRIIQSLRYHRRPSFSAYRWGTYNGEVAPSFFLPSFHSSPPPFSFLPFKSSSLKFSNSATRVRRSVVVGFGLLKSLGLGFVLEKIMSDGSLHFETKSAKLHFLHWHNAILHSSPVPLLRVEFQPRKLSPQSDLQWRALKKRNQLMATKESKSTVRAIFRTTLEYIANISETVLRTFILYHCRPSVFQCKSLIMSYSLYQCRNGVDPTPFNYDF